MFARCHSAHSLFFNKSLHTLNQYCSFFPADVGEIKRVVNTDTYLHTLRKYTNYSVQVLAFTNAGDGKRSPPVYCMTEEDGNIFILFFFD